MQIRAIFTALLVVATTSCALANEPHNSLQEDQDWYIPKAENLVLFELDTGNVIIELAPFFAPNHVQHFRAQIQQQRYDDIHFYRVIEGFVAQAGPEGAADEAPLAAEFERSQDNNTDWLLVQQPALLAKSEGYLNHFAAARDETNEWLVHCPGALAMARSNEPDSAANHFYVVLGHAPRHLDRNMTIFGRVIKGMEHLQALPRGSVEAGGVIQSNKPRGSIKKAELFSMIDSQERPSIRIQKTTGAAYTKRLTEARARNNEFFIYKGNGALDICYYPPRVEMTLPETKRQAEKLP